MSSSDEEIYEIAIVGIIIFIHQEFVLSDVL